MPKTTNITPTSNNRRPPVVLALGAMDPAGGGGIQADIETAASLGCHCAPIATALCTSVETESATTIPVDTTLLIEQARSVLEAMPVAAIKVGFAGSVANIEAIHSILRDYPHIPVSLHPALNLWDQNAVDQAGLLDAFVELLLSQASAVNLSLPELHQLAPEADTLDASAQALIDHGCDYLLVCNTSRQAEHVQNSLFRAQGLVKHYQWEQTAVNCYGASSTLAASVACYLGHNSHPVSAIEQGQNFTWQAMVAARNLGSGGPIPHRFFWADEGVSTSGEPPAETGTH